MRITLDLFPEQPYSFWRQSRPGIGGQTLFILGLKPDTSGRGLAQMRPPAGTGAASLPQAPHYLRGSRSRKRPRLRRSRPWRSTSQRRPPGTWFPAALPNCASLMPKAGALLQSLENEGWTVAESHTYDRPGQRSVRDFILANQKYPELAVKIVYLPANVARNSQYRHRQPDHRQLVE